MNVQETLLKLLIKEPFYGHIASKLTITQKLDINKLNITVYPIFELKYNLNWFNSLDENKKYGYLLHELIHIILQHPFRRGDKDKSLWALACDIAVNQYIDTYYKDNSWIDIELIAREFNIKLQYWQSSEYYYSILKKLNMNIKGSPSGDSALITLNNKNYEVDIIQDQQKNENNLQLLNTIISKSINISNSKIDSINELYSDYLVDWRMVLKKFLSFRGRRDKRRSYKKISRRFDNYPGNIYNKGCEALIALDESGSMPDSLIDIYITELREINKITGVKIKIVRFDSECSKPVPLSQYMTEKKRIKRGSTDFNPIFKIADKLKIPVVIIFTDGKGSCPTSVNQKVLWLLTTDGVNPSNFGEVMYFT